MLRISTVRKKIVVTAIAIAAVIAALLWFNSRGKLMLSGWSFPQASAYMKSFGYWGILLGSALIALQTFIPFAPFIVLAGANVMVFGLWLGFLITWSGAVLGAVLMFAAAKTFGRRWALKRLNSQPRLSHISGYIEKNQFWVVLLLRLFPVIPSVLLNIVAGVSPVSFATYTWATAIGKVPVIFLESILIYNVLQFSKYRVLVVMIAIILVIGFIVGARILKKRMKIP